MTMNMQSRKGISMVEVVVTLVVITIISLATLSVIFVSVNVETKTIVAMEVRNCAENAIECFRFANGNVKTFIECLNKTGQNFEYKGSNGSYVSNLEKYVVTIVLKYENEKLIGFAYWANDAAGADIYNFTFTNGGKQG